MVACVKLCGLNITQMESWHAGEEMIAIINSCNVRCVGHVARKRKLGHGVTEFLAANMVGILADPLRQEDN